MKLSFYTLFALLCLTHNIAFSQQQSKLSDALNHIQQHAESLGLEPSDVAQLVLSSEMYSKKSGITYVYLNQTFDGIPVRNAMATISFGKKGNVAHLAENLQRKITSKIQVSQPEILPDFAMLQAAEHLGQRLASKPQAIGRNDQGKLVFNWPELTKSDIILELKYEVVGEKLVLVWNMNLDMAKSADYWDLNIDAVTGAYVSKLNLTTYCNHHKDAYAKHDNCQIKTFRTIQENALPVSHALHQHGAARYQVFGIPVESPSHGEREIVSDDQYPQSSPFGWHDTDGVDGVEYTTTRGNNVFAYQDRNNDDSPDGTETEGGAGLVFEFPLDMQKDPRESADATVTNLFYMVNMMHDVSAVLGFDEAAGNFQQKNYSGAPGQGDYVLAQAFDGIDLATPTLNNANFSTPSDGGNGRMQMFLWENPGGAVSIDSPDDIKGFINTYGTGNFGRSIPQANEPAITGAIAIGKDASPSNPTACCGPIVNTSETAGKIVMIDRGLCEFGRKVLNAQQAGAIAAIVCNIAGVNGGNGDEILSMAGGAVGDQVTIPSIFMRKSDCDRIRVSLAAGNQVFMTFKVRERVGAEFLDGSLDNGIIAHEFGHGISIRLTGGRLNSGCLGNDEQMGEGWSDFFSLVMTNGAEDRGDQGRGIGTFAVGQTPEGRGIRRFPYSTNMSVNPQTYDFIKGTTAPHPLGEVWTAMLWDMYWKFIDLYGFDPDWSNENSGNHKAVYLVIEGMKMQQCNPGFIQGRDAILKADQEIFNGAHKCLIWEVFARRGLGINAVGGDTDDRGDGVEDYEALPTCIEKLKIQKTVSSLVKPGEEISVQLRAINHLPERQSDVVIIDELEAGLSYVEGSSAITPEISGNTLIFKIGDLDYDKPFQLSYKVRTSSTNKSQTLFFDNFEGEITWEPETAEGAESWLPDYELSRSPETSLYVPNFAADLDASIRTPYFEVNGTHPAMRFWHQYNTQVGLDGGFVEISVDGGLYSIVPASQFIRNSYNSDLAYGTLAIPALKAFTGSSNGQWVDSYLDLSDYIGREVSFKYRFGSDATGAPSTNFAGWYIDDFEMMDLFKYKTKACIAADGGQGVTECTSALETIVDSDGMVSSNQESIDYFGLTLQPNPASDYVIVKASTKDPVLVNISVTGVDGKLMMTSQKMLSKDNQWVMDTHSLASGLYFVTLMSGNQTSVQKLVIR